MFIISQIALTENSPEFFKALTLSMSFSFTRLLTFCESLVELRSIIKMVYCARLINVTPF